MLSMFSIETVGMVAGALTTFFLSRKLLKHGVQGQPKIYPSACLHYSAQA
jgi:uncharacterized protein YneF (UPF0154 family)